MMAARSSAAAVPRRRTTSRAVIASAGAASSLARATVPAPDGRSGSRVTMVRSCGQDAAAARAVSRSAAVPTHRTSSPASRTISPACSAVLVA